MKQLWPTMMRLYYLVILVMVLQSKSSAKFSKYTKMITEIIVYRDLESPLGSSDILNRFLTLIPS